MSSMQCEDSTAFDYYCREPLTEVESCPSPPSCSMFKTCDECSKEVNCIWCEMIQECIQVDDNTKNPFECDLIYDTCPTAVPTIEFKGALAVIPDNSSGFGGSLYVEGQSSGFMNGHSYKLQVDKFKMELKSAGLCLHCFPYYLVSY
jgi:hypothetical protein